MKRMTLISALCLLLLPGLAAAQWYGGTAGVNNAGAGTGAGWLDYDRNGILDIYAATDGGTMQLYRQFAGGTFADFVSGSLAQTGAIVGVAIVDYDNDGDSDAYLSRVGEPNTLLANVFLSSYSDVTTPELADGITGTYSGAWGDYDNDGDLDLYVVNASPDACKLLRNDGGTTFVDVTPAPLGVLESSRNAYWIDYDNDGDLDLHRVNASASANDNLFRNDGGGVFVDMVPLGAGIPGTDGGTAAWGDYNNDGLIDVFLASSLGVGSNFLYRNLGGGSFANATTDSLYNDAQTNISGTWIDYDNDGDLDLYVVKDGAANEFHRNDGNGVFTEVAGGVELDAGDGRSAITADYDADGDIDIYLTNDGANILLRNDNPAGNWLHVDLDGVFSNRSAVGARVRISQGGVSQFRWVLSNNGLSSTNHYRLEFGLASAAPVDTIEVIWPSGAFQQEFNFAANQVVQITEPGGNYLDVTNGEPILMSGLSNRGVAWADYDGDGDLDAFVALESSSDPNRLLRNDGPAGFVDRTVGALAGLSEVGSCIVWADLDNDGDPDAILADYTGVRIMRNDGSDTWTNITAGPLGVDRGTLAVALADYDGDGDLDMFLANSNFSDTNQLLENDGTGVFTDVTPGVLGVSGSTQAAAWGDYDNDGDPDLFVARSFETNFLFENQGGFFTDVTDPVLVDGSASAFGAEWIDYNNDGNLDLYLTRQQDANSLYQGDGAGGFAEVVSPGAAGVAALRTAWGDFDLDGDLDFFQLGGVNSLFLNDGFGSFADAALYPEASPGLLGLGQGASFADIDDDGDLDLFVSGQSENSLLENVGASGNWLRVHLQGVESNRDGVGARVRVSSASGTQEREVKAQGDRGMEPSEAHFGLGTDLSVFSVVVDWPSGRQSVTPSPGINTEITIVEPGDFVSGNWPGLADAGNGESAAFIETPFLDFFVANALENNARLEFQEGSYVNSTPPSLELGTEANFCVRAGDYDNDGDADLYVTQIISGGGHLFRNDGGSIFVDVTAGDTAGPADAFGAAWADIDLDGDIDLYVAGRTGSNALLRNDGGDVFVDITTPAIALAAVSTYGVSFGDYDDDGDPDLYVCNNGATNNLFQNDGSGVFTDVTTPVLADSPTGVSYSAPWGDFDGDRDLDLYLANAGEGNRLFRNDGGGVFVDVATSPINAVALWLDAAWADYDNDGDLDLHVTRNGVNALFRNDGSEVFVDMAPTIPDMVAQTSRGGSWVDINNDGLLDMYVVNNGPNSLMENRTSNAGDFLKVKLEGTLSNRDGYGARVRLSTMQVGATTPDGLAATANSNIDQIRERNTDHGAFSQNSEVLHFGVGSDFIINFLEVTWPSGIVQDVTVGDVLGTTITVVEQAPPGIDYATPNTSRADTDGFLMQAFGSGLSVSAAPRLDNGAGSILTAYFFNGVGGESRVDMEFDLLPAVPGSYDLIIPTSGGDLILTLPNALVIHAETSDLTRATTDPSMDRNPVFSPNGLDMAFATDRFDTFLDLTIKAAAAPDFGPLPRLTNFLTDSTFPSFSPDGSDIAFSTGLGDVYVVDVATGTPVQIFSGAAFIPAWSPLGDRLAFTHTVLGQKAIYLMDPDGSNLTQLTDPAPGLEDRTPSWSPDGTQVIFARSPDAGSTTMFMAVPAIGGEAAGFEVVFPNNGAANYNPVYSPDGRWVAFWANTGGQFDIWVTSSRGPAFGLYQITTNTAIDLEPSWSPDGTQLAFASFRSGVSDIFVATNMPFQQDTDGDLVPNSVDACPLVAPLPGQVDRDFDGCADETSSFRFVEFWSDDQLPVRYETDAIGDPRIGDGSDFTALGQAFAAWVNVGNVVLSGGDDFTRAGPSNAVSGDGRNSITFSDGDGFLPGILAITPTTSAVSETFINGRWYRPGEIIDADMLFNTAQFSFGTASSPGPAGSFDLLSLATHEFGHFFGLSHTSLSASTMFYVVSPGTAQRTPEEDDITLVQRAYFSTAPQLSIEGLILDADGLTPVIGAAVFAISDASDDTLQMTVSGPDGIYRFYDLGEAVRIWTHPLDGSANVNGMIPGIINPTLEAAAQTLFLPEYFDGPSESNSDFGAPGIPVFGATTPVLGADIILNQDQTGPFVLSSTPANLDIDVAATTAILVRFDEAIDPASITGNFNLLLGGSTPVTGAGALLEGGTLLAVTPTAPLQYGAPYNLDIATGITDLFGNPLQEPYSASFTVQAQPPVTIASLSPNQAAEQGALVITGTGFDPNAGNNVIFFGGGVSVAATQATPTQITTAVPVGALSGIVTVEVGGIPSNGVFLTVLAPKAPPAGNDVDDIALGSDPRKMTLTPSGAAAYVATDLGVTYVNALPTDPNFTDSFGIGVAGGCVDVAALPDGLRVLAVGPTNPRLTAISSDPSNLFNQVLQTANLVEEPLGITPVPGGSRVAIAYANRVVLVEGAPGAAFGSEVREWVASGFQFTGELVASPSVQELHATTNAGEIAVLGLATGEGVVALLMTGPNPSGVAPGPNGNRVYAVDGVGTLSEFGVRGPFINSRGTAPAFSGLAMSPEGRYAYASNFTLNRVDVFDLATSGLDVVETWPTGVDPRDIKTGPTGRYVYVLTGQQDLLEVFDTEGGPLLASVSPPSGGQGTLITLSGAGFDPVPGNNTVEVDGLAATVVKATATRLVVVQPSGAASGGVRVNVAGQNSNTLQYRVVNRTGPGTFQLGQTIPTANPQLSRIYESPSGKLLVAMGIDGSMQVLGADPGGSEFLREIQTLSSAQTGMSLQGDLVFTPDGKRAYAFGEGAALGPILIFDVDETGTGNPLTLNGTVLTGGGGTAQFGGPSFLAMHPDGTRLFASSSNTGSVRIISTTTQEITQEIFGFGTDIPIAVHPDGDRLFIGDTTTPSASIAVIDIDPASPGFLLRILTLTSNGINGPYQVIPSPDGTRLYALTGDVVGVTEELSADIFIVDEADLNYGILDETIVVATDEEVQLQPNRSGTVLYVLHRNIGGGIDAYTVNPLSPAGSAGTTGFSVSDNFALSKDDTRMYSAGFGGVILTVGSATATGIVPVSGTAQTGVANQPLAAPIVMGITAASQPLAEGTLVEFNSPDGSFGWPDGRFFAAADASGHVSAPFTPGAVTNASINVITPAGPVVLNFPVVGDTTAVPPQILNVEPTQAQVPGVTTVVAVTFSKAVDPATVNTANYQLRPQGGTAVAGVFGYTDQGRRVTFLPNLALEPSTVYEIEVTAAVMDFSGNPLTNPAVFTFTTETPVPLVLNATDPPAARAGNPVVLSGQGFGATVSSNRVFFGTSEAFISQADPRALTVLVPSGAVSGLVRVVVGADSSNALPFTVLVPPPDPVVGTTSTVDVPSSGQDIVITPDGSRAYMAAPGANSVVPIVVATEAVEPSVSVGQHPFGVSTSPSGDRVYTTNYFSHSVSVMDAVPGSPTFQQVIATIPTGLNPTGVVSHPDGRELYVLCYGDSTINVIDTDSTSATYNSGRASIRTDGGGQGVDVTPDGGRLLVGSSTGFVIFDTNDFDAGRASIRTDGGSQGIDVTPDGGLAVVLTTNNFIEVVDILDGSPTFGAGRASIRTDSGGQGVDVSPDGAFVYVTNSGGTVDIYRLTISGGSGATSPDGAGAPVTLEFILSITVGENPVALAFDPTGSGLLVVVNAGSQTVTFINISDVPELDDVLTLIEPGTFNLNSNGKYVSATIQPAEPFGPEDIDPSSIRMNGVVEPVLSKTSYGDNIEDGVPDVKFKFPRQEVFASLEEGQQVPITVTGTIGGYPFTGVDTVKVLRPKIKSPHGGQGLVVGSSFTIEWDSSPQGSADYLDIYFSDNGGDTWQEVALQTDDDQMEEWLVPEAYSANCQLLIVANESDGTMIGSSMVPEPFSVGPSVSTPATPLRFALHPAMPNPFSSATQVLFELPDPTTVAVRIFGVDGTLVRTLVREQAFQAGAHAVPWDGRDESGRVAGAGVYFIRIQAGVNDAVRKVIRVR